MPSKKKKYNARFPAGRIKKIMQTDEEVGKVAQAVPVIISRTLELFVESLLTKTLRVTNARNAKTLSPSHMKQCIMSESRFDFLRELVKNIPDISLNDELLELECGSPGEQTGDNSPTSAPSSPPPGFSRMNSYPNGQNSNRPLPNLHSLNMRSLDLPSTSSMNFYKETDANSVTSQQHHQPVITSTVIQHTSNHSNNINNNHSSNPSNNVNIRKDYGRPPKLARFDSAPCNLTLNTGYKIDLTPKINTPNISITNNNNNKPIYSIDLSKSFNLHHPNSLHKGHHTISTPPHQHDLPPVLKIDLSSAYQHLPSTSKEIPSPPIIKSDVCSTPTVKIDYSSIALTSSPLCSPTGPAPPISSPLMTVLNKPSEKPKMLPLPATITSNSNNNSYITAKEPTPSTASIDLTNIHTNSNFTNTKNMLSTNSLEMDEDYDDL